MMDFPLQEGNLARERVEAKPSNSHSTPAADPNGLSGPCAFRFRDRVDAT